MTVVAHWFNFLENFVYIGLSQTKNVLRLVRAGLPIGVPPTPAPACITLRHGQGPWQCSLESAHHS